MIIGEAWQEIMMDCSSQASVKCDSNSDELDKDSCGSDIAFPYFISFYVLCSFLVSASCNYLILVLFYYLDQRWDLGESGGEGGMLCAPKRNLLPWNGFPSLKIYHMYGNRNHKHSSIITYPHIEQIFIQ